MKNPCIISIDEGTTGTRAISVAEDGRILFKSYKPLDISHPKPGWVEQNPEELWNNTYEVLKEVYLQSVSAGYEITGIGISNQRETTVIWDKNTGKPLLPAIVWQCRRTSATCAELKSKGLEPQITKLTGLPIDPYFSATKMAWMLANIPSDHHDDEIAMGTVDTWLLWNLTQGASYATDVTNASRTQLFNIHTLEWDAELCRLFGIPCGILPSVKKSADFFGETRGLRDIPDCIPILALIGDSQAALLGEGALAVGRGKVTYGTGSSILVNVGDRPLAAQGGLALTLAWQLEDELAYAVEGIIHATGSAVEWLKDNLGLFSDALETEALAKSVPDNGGVFLVPAFSGLGTPWWDQNARGLLIGLTGGTRREHVVRAALDAIALQVYDVFESIRKTYPINIERIHCGGGGSRNAYLMQLQANLLECPLVTGINPEASAMGAAYLVGLKNEFWTKTDLVSLRIADAGAKYTPQEEHSAYKGLIQGWHKAVERSLNWIQLETRKE